MSALAECLRKLEEYVRFDEEHGGMPRIEREVIDVAWGELRQDAVDKVVEGKGPVESEGRG